MYTALADLKASTNEIRLVLNEIVGSTTAITLSDQKIQRSNKLICSSVPVVLSGHLETFLRDSSKRFMLRLAAKGKAFGSLPSAMQSCHYSSGGWVLHKLQENRVSWVTCTPQDLLTRMAAGVNSAPSLPIWEAFGDTEGNPSAPVIKRFLLDYGIVEPTNLIDAKAGATGRKWSSFASDLKVFIEARNICAHTGQLTIPPGPTVLIGYCDMVDELGLRITEVLEDHLAGI